MRHFFLIAVAVGLFIIMANSAHARILTWMRGDMPLTTFAVELAQSAQEQKRGLMGRHYLAANMGMLFVMHPPRRVRFWMRNTYIPLDMIFIVRDAVGRAQVSEIISRYDILSDAYSTSDGTVIAVLELNAGTAAARDLRVGDWVVHSALNVERHGASGR